MTSDSLLASARVVPASSAASVGRSPTEPVIPLSTTSQASPANSLAASGPVGSGQPEVALGVTGRCASA